jgi:polar amino acid transport system substrate-binding protein
VAQRFPVPVRSWKFYPLLCLLALTGTLASSGGLQARPLEDVKARGLISVCAPPNALPFASKTGDRPGYQIELAEALAERLDVRLQVNWVTLAYHRQRADCDLIMDTIADREAQKDNDLHWSKPYQRSGVALAVQPESDGIAGFGDLAGRRIGVLRGSLAHMILQQQGAQTIPFGFEDDMLSALAGGEIEAAAATPMSIGYYNLTHPDQQVKLLYAYDAEPQLAWDLAVGMRRSDHSLRKAVDEAVEAMIEDGTFDRIYAAYGIEHRPPKAEGPRRVERQNEPEMECIRIGNSRRCSPVR